MLRLTAAQTVVTTAVGHNATLPCNVVAYPQWSGPSQDGNTIYNLEEYTEFASSKLGSKATRLFWGINKADLVISDVVREEDDGKYYCLRLGVITDIQLVVRGMCKVKGKNKQHLLICFVKVSR